MSTAFGFGEVVRRLEARLARELALERIELPRELSRLEGCWRDEPAALEARAYRGPHVRFARFVELHGVELEIGNVLCLSVPELPLPIFGADLVGLGRDTAVVVADLSVVASDEEQRRGQLEVLREHRAAGPRLSRAGELPAWAARWFSSEAVLARVGLGEAELVPRALADFAAAFVRLATAASSPPHAELHVSAQQTAYCRDHRDHDRGLQLLRRIFEPALADRFLREILFPERLPA
jgi:phycocyanobilin:ferredoxin oxidoreductase